METLFNDDFLRYFWGIMCAEDGKKQFVIPPNKLNSLLAFILTFQDYSWLKFYVYIVDDRDKNAIYITNNLSDANKKKCDNYLSFIEERINKHNEDYKFQPQEYSEHVNFSVFFCANFHAEITDFERCSKQANEIKEYIKQKLKSEEKKDFVLIRKILRPKKSRNKITINISEIEETYEELNGTKTLKPFIRLLHVIDDLNYTITGIDIRNDIITLTKNKKILYDTELRISDDSCKKYKLTLKQDFKYRIIFEEIGTDTIRECTIKNGTFQFLKVLYELYKINKGVKNFSYKEIEENLDKIRTKQRENTKRACFKHLASKQLFDIASRVRYELKTKLGLKYYPTTSAEEFSHFLITSAIDKLYLQKNIELEM